MFKSNRNAWNRVEKKAVEEKRWFIFRWEVLAILGLALLAALLNEIPNWYVKPLPDGTIDPILSYPLINNITYTSISIFITVGVSIFIGVFTEVGKFAGKYGSAIFVLVPSFVWLLSDRSDDRIEEIVDTAAFLGNLIFWSIVGILSTFVLLMGVRLLLRHVLVSRHQKFVMEFTINYINRFLLIMTNILIVLMLGYTLINYGILSLHLTDITPEMHAEHPELASKTHNLHSEEFTTYIALIAVFFALLMVMIGLSNIITKKAKSENDFVTQEIETLHEDYNAKSEEEESTQGGSYG